MAAWFSALVLGLTALLAVRVARADDYQDALARGVEARDRALETDLGSDWQLALEEFSRALELRPTKEVRFEWAEAAARLRFEDEAFEAYQRALAEGLGGRAAQRARLFVQTREPEFCWLDISGPEGARVLVRGRERGTLPFEKPLAVLSGMAELEVRSKRQDEAPYRQVLEAKRGETASVAVKFAKSEAPKVDQQPTTQASRSEPDAREVEAPPETVIVAAKRERWATRTLIFAGGLVVAGAATYVVAGELLRNENRKLGRYCAEFDGDRCTYATAENAGRAERASNRIETLEWTRLIGAGGVAVGLVGGVVVYLVSRPTIDEQPKLGLALGPRGFSASYTGRF